MRRAHRALVSSFALAGLAAIAVAPSAQAATVLSRSDASAIEVNVGGQGAQGSGRVNASFDGKERVSGATTPSFSGGAGQTFFNGGVLAQEAVARSGQSAACAGLGGSGGTFQIGESSCLEPGNQLNASLGALRLSGLELTPGEFDVPDDVELPVDLDLPAVLEDVTPQIDEAIAQFQSQLESQAGAFGLTAQAQLVQGRCTVDGGGPTGIADLLGTRIIATGAGQEFTVADLDDSPNPAPNTDVFTDLSAVLDEIFEAASSNLETSLGGALAPLDAAVAPIQQQIVSNVRTQFDQQLAPLEDNLLHVTLNEQTPGPGSIRVTALHARLVPAAEQFIDASLIDLKIGDVGCGPADVVAAATPEAAPPVAAPATPRIPTAVSAGVAGEPDGGPGAAAYGVLALGVGAVGVTGIVAARRRRLVRA